MIFGWIFVVDGQMQQCGCPKYGHDLTKLNGTTLHYAATKESDNKNVDISVCSPLKECQGVCGAVARWGDLMSDCGATFDTQTWYCSQNQTWVNYYECLYGFFMIFQCNQSAIDPVFTYFNFSVMQFGATGYAYIATNLVC